MKLSFWIKSYGHVSGIWCSFVFCHDLSLIILKLSDRGWQFWKIFYFTWFCIKFQEKSPNFKELAQKLQELWTKTFGGSLKTPLVWIGLITEIENSLPPRKVQGGHKPGKHGKHGKLREFKKLSKSQGKLREIWTFVEKTWKTQGKWKYVTWSPTNMHSIEFLFLQLLREIV